MQPPPIPNDPKTPDSQRQAYNVVTDLVAGPNVRFKDNLYQGLAVLAGIALGAGIGAMVSSESRAAGAIVGGILGMVAGLLLSGIFLMIFRAVMHARGKHD